MCATLTLGRLRIAGVVLTVTACQYDPYAHRYETSEPKVEAIVGEYYLSRHTMASPPPEDLVTGDDPGAPRIWLNADGTYRFSAFPVWIEDWSVYYEMSGEVSPVGRWRIDTVGGNEYVRHYGVRFEPDVDGVAKIADDGTALIFGYGDPDSGTAMVFTKKNNGAG